MPVQVPEMPVREICTIYTGDFLKTKDVFPEIAKILENYTKST